ncbi:microtubule-associated protein RP/EB family member 1-like [Drosophila hydei]|uniref:Microtubule-associated protein RP/EB family member 1-like n=1 Tax=Drosophila hydei TaxID=7224 RepID=A0A6J1LDT8_DROHY|nr:microtubule-associated protein RP/EB family member 1-like [Drosophila hydei]
MALNRLVNVISTNNTKPTWSRQAILSWCNKCLSSNIQKIDDLCTGAAYCCLMDILVPDSVNFSKVKFKCYMENDYISNFILLQQCFNKYKVDKSIPIYKLVKGKFQDNYEFAVWFRLFFEANFNKMPDGYDAMLKRNYQTLAKDLINTSKIQHGTPHSILPKTIRARSRTREPLMQDASVRVAPITAVARARANGGLSTDTNRH